MWSAITPSDIAGYPADGGKALMGDASWASVMRLVGISGAVQVRAIATQTISFPANDASGLSQANVPIGFSWSNHIAYIVTYFWPYGHWNFRMKIPGFPNAPSYGTIVIENTGGAQQFGVAALTIGVP